jgi:hypothetical protein
MPAAQYKTAASILLSGERLAFLSWLKVLRLNFTLRPSFDIKIGGSSFEDIAIS